MMGVYGLGKRRGEISEWMEEKLGNGVCGERISGMRDGVVGEIKGWGWGRVERVYGIVWMDGIDYKVMEERGCGVRGGI